MFYLSEPYNTISFDYKEPMRAIRISTVYNTIGTDNNEPIRAIRISTVPQQSVLTISSAVISPESNELITMISSYGHVSDQEPERAIRMHTIPL